MQLIIVLQVLLQKEKNIHFYKPQPSNVYKSFHEFKLCTKTLALNKLWELNIQEQLVIKLFTSSEYVLPTSKIYINNLLNFTVRVHSWILPVDHELYLLYNSFYFICDIVNFC